MQENESGIGGTPDRTHQHPQGIEGYIQSRHSSGYRVSRSHAGLPEYDESTKSYPMEWRDLVVMVEGISEDPASRLRRLRAERTTAFATDATLDFASSIRCFKSENN